ncbi:hypothetical protein [Nocardia amikacinitolerans]|uniref:hypothetical protein n=1 Tax=Nocardia amikacinitolerans TaxID=756689 RepID=UPI000BE40C89|nr:hypothetical protein [Nocardia amikacinitolerans]
MDEAGFAFESEEPAELEEAFAVFLELLDYARSTPGTVKRSDELFDIESGSGRTLVDHLLDSRIDRDIRQELHGRLDKIARYEEDPGEWEFAIGAKVLPIAPSIGICVMMAAKQVLIACLTTSTAGRRGAERVVSRTGGPGAQVHFLADETDAPPFWRSILDSDPDLLDNLAEHQHLPFPDIVFAEEIWDQLGRFSGPPLVVRRQVIANLAGLNDHAPRIWSTEKQSVQRVKLMQIEADVICSPESPNTHKNAKAMRQRLVDFDGEQISCEWHAKLSPTCNRIHFAVREGQLFVGIFDEHLPV